MEGSTWGGRHVQWAWHTTGRTHILARLPTGLESALQEVNLRVRNAPKGPQKRGWCGVDRGARETRVGPGGRGASMRGVTQRVVGINVSVWYGGR